MFDCMIKNGTLVDGTGASPVAADVAIKDGRVAAVGKIAGEAERHLDASGRIVAPGFIDPHTHYDAQLSWDPLVTPSSWHGVTTVVIGNCGVGLAPSRPGNRDDQVWDLVNVEAMDKTVLDAGIDWQWESFPEYMQATMARGCAVNVGFLAPLSPLRNYVLGGEASERGATVAEIDTLSGLLGEALSAGALGFSASNFPIHNGYGGKPLSSRLTSVQEYRAYAGVMARAGRGAIELAVTKELVTLADDEYALLEMLLGESGRPVTWISLLDMVGQPEKLDHLLERNAPLAPLGSRPQTMVRPFLVGVEPKNPFIFGSIPSWKQAFGKRRDELKALYASKTFRDAFRADLAARQAFGFSGDWSLLTLVDTPDDASRVWLHKTVAEIAAETGRDPVDAFLDLTLAGDLETRFTLVIANADPDRLAQLVVNPDTPFGLGDGGAHVDMLCEAGYPTYVLGHWVRERGVLTLPQAVHRLTQEPAELFGIKDRGVLREGMAADIVVFDADTVGSDQHPRMVTDLPAGGKRLIAESQGIDYTLVNGKVTWERGVHSGELPGRIAC